LGKENFLRKTVKILHQIYSVVIIMIFTLSCYHYSAVRISADIPLSDKIADKKSMDQDGNKHKQISADKRRINLIKYFAKYFSTRPAAGINNRGVEYALEGRFKEAEVLFKEAIKEDVTMVPAYNNLGIIYEIFGQKSKAFEMYSSACLKYPDNDYFRKNLLYMIYEEKK
jgi:tetratricopeptide (TPR) repeat protein